MPTDLMRNDIITELNLLNSNIIDIRKVRDAAQLELDRVWRDRDYLAKALWDLDHACKGPQV